MSLKIAVYSIAKDEQENVIDFVGSCKAADLILVGVDENDTTGDLLINYGAKIVRIRESRFRFDRYRNIVLNSIPSDIDVCVSLDLDERLPLDWRKKIEKVWKTETTRLRYHLQWSEDRKFLYDRIHSRYGYKWRYANHECVVWQRVDRKESVVQSDLVITHVRDSKKDRSKNLPLLQLAVEEEPESARMLWYLGREYYYENLNLEAIETFINYLKYSDWKAERSWAMIFMARCEERLGEFFLAETYLIRAISECVDLRDPYFELAKFYEKRQQYSKAIDQLKIAITIHQNRDVFHETNHAYSEQIYVFLASLYEKCENFHEAANSYKKALRIASDDKIEAKLRALEK